MMPNTIRDQSWERYIVPTSYQGSIMGEVYHV